MENPSTPNIFSGLTTTARLEDARIMSISLAKTQPKDSYVSIFGVVLQDFPLTSHQKYEEERNGERKPTHCVTRKSLTICDREGTSTTVTVWNNLAERLEKNKQLFMLEPCIIYFRNLRVNLFEGKIDFTSYYYDTVMQIDPVEIDAEHWKALHEQRLKHLKQFGAIQFPTPIMLDSETTNKKFSKIADIKWQEQPFDVCFYTVKGKIVKFIGQSLDYKGCHSDSCRKEVEHKQGGFYFCPKCGKCSHNALDRLKIKFSVCDADGSEIPEVSCFLDKKSTPFGNVESFEELRQNFEGKDFICRLQVKRYSRENVHFNAESLTISQEEDPSVAE